MVKKVISSKLTKSQPQSQDQIVDESGKTARTKKPCFYCQNEHSSSSNKTLPTYTDIATLRRYQTDRAKIVPKLKSGLCSKHQRGATKQIKYARHLSLLPFTPKV